MSKSERRTLHVGGLADEVTQQLLQAAFIPFGEVVEVQLPKEMGSGPCPGLSLSRAR